MTGGQLRRWERQGPDTNIALRLSEGVLGIDVDDYDGRAGGSTLRRLVELCGPLPPTVRSSSRDDGLSGIYLYRVPVGLPWVGVVDVGQPDGEITGGIELIWRMCRYAVCWPSVHPERRRYRWWGPDGQRLQDLPSLEDLPWLPAKHVAMLVKPDPHAADHLFAPRAAVLGSPGVRDRDPRAVSILERELSEMRRSRPGRRNDRLNRAAFTLAGLSELDAITVSSMLLQAALDAGLEHGEAVATITSGMTAGTRLLLS